MYASYFSHVHDHILRHMIGFLVSCSCSLETLKRFLFIIVRDFLLCAIFLVSSIFKVTYRPPCAVFIPIRHPVFTKYLSNVRLWCAFLYCWWCCIYLFCGSISRYNESSFLMFYVITTLIKMYSFSSWECRSYVWCPWYADSTEKTIKRKQNPRQKHQFYYVWRGNQCLSHCLKFVSGFYCLASLIFRYLLILFRDAPVEVWMMTKNPIMVKGYGLAYLVLCVTCCH